MGQFKVLGGEFDLLTAVHHCVGRRKKAIGPNGKFQYLIAQPSAKRVYACEKLLPADLFDHVIVSAAGQRVDDIGFVVSLCNEEDRDVTCQLVTYPTQHFEPGAVGQLPVEDKQIRLFPSQLIVQRHRIAEMSNHMLSLLQPRLHECRLRLIIFQKPDLHSGAILGARNGYGVSTAGGLHEFYETTF